MKIHDCEQYSDEWWSLRKGRFTASMAKKLVTPTGRPSTQWKGEVATILAEAMGWQEPPPRAESYWMSRGTEMEAEARNWLSLELDEDLDEIGFISLGDHIGGSPDAILKLDRFTNRGGKPDWKTTIPIEIKCPKPSTHIAWLLDGGLPSDHIAQVHFHMILAEAPYAYFFSYHPECEPLLVKVERNDYTLTMYDAITEYVDAFKSAYKRVIGVDYGSI
jgi:hypothetical protein